MLVLKNRSKIINKNWNTNFIVAFLFFYQAILTSVSFAHQTAGGLSQQHQQEDQYLAQQARERNEVPFQNRKRIGTAKIRGAANVVGQWGAVKTWPFVYASAANLPDGRIIAWGGNNRTFFSGGKYTHTGVWDPLSDTITEYGYDQHSMFCAIPTLREDGTVFVVGGDGPTKNRTSLFDFRSNEWSHIGTANTGRWYNGSLQLPNGQVFMALGTEGSRYPELWTDGVGWNWLTGIDLQGPILNHTSYGTPHWFPQMTVEPNGKVLHVGPTPNMHFIDTQGNGSIVEAGAGIEGWDANNSAGHIVVYDEGKILALGGTVLNAKNKASIVDMNHAVPQVETINNMIQPRTFSNSVVLPTGEVMVVGGNNSDKWFSDQGTILTPEIWNPQTKQWRQVADHAIPRNYHSVALLMADGRVFSGGGGLCRCAADHPDHQIYSPAYLFNADGSLAQRPVIESAPDVVTYGETINVRTSEAITKFTMVKMSGTTHAFNSDLRFLSIPFTGSDLNYQLNLESNRNVMTPGYWMVFALNAQGTPSVSKIIQVRSLNPNTNNTEGPYRYVKLVAESEVNGNAWASAAEIKVLDANGNEINRNGWSATASSQETNGTASFAIDGNIHRMWHTRYSTNLERHPHHIIIDMGTGYDLSGFRYLPRQDASMNGTIAQYKFYVSGDGINWSQAVSQGVFANDRNEKTATFSGVTPIFNLSKGKEVTQSSNYNNSSIAAKAVDGNTNGNFSAGSVTHTGNDLNAWWEVDLGKRHQLSTLKIWNRTDCCGNRLSNFHVLVSDVPFVSKDLQTTINQQGVTNIDFSGVAGQTTTLAINRTGRYVRIQLAGQNYLQLAEVEVLGSLEEVIEPISLSPINLAPPQSVETLVQYTINSTGGGAGLRYKWNFGDGRETDWMTSTTVQHSYSHPGRYLVKVFATDDHGQTAEQAFNQSVHGHHTTRTPQHSSTLIYESHTGVERIWNVNPDNNTVTVINASTHQKIKEISVGKQPQSLAINHSGYLLVTNKKSSTISAISLANLSVLLTIDLPTGSQPHGIAMSPRENVAYVALEAKGQLAKINAATGEITQILDVGSNPRHVSIEAFSDGNIYVSRFITPPVPGESTSNPNVSQGGGEVVVIDIASMSIDRTIKLNYNQLPDTDSGGRGIPNYLGPLVISPDGLSGWVPSKMDNITRGVLRDGLNLNHENTVRSISSYVDLVNQREVLGRRIDHNNGGIANAAAFGKFGSYLFVALEGTRDIAVVDAYGFNEIGRFDVGFAPQGLAVSSNGNQLAVHNFMDRSVMIFDLSTLINQGEVSISHINTIKAVSNENLTPTVLLGKKLFYDAKDERLVRDGYLSCASCHNDGGHDGRVWDTTGFGEGLRNTIDLNGRGGMAQGLLHWSANFDEVQDFENQIRSWAGGTGLMTDSTFNQSRDPLGTPKAGKSADLDALAAYVTSLAEFDVSPYRKADGSLTDHAVQGKQVFSAAGCGTCHSGSAFTDSSDQSGHDIGTIKPSSGNRLGGALSGIDTPTLKGVWMGAPFLHDGSALTLKQAVQAHQGVSLTNDQLDALQSYLNQIDKLEDSSPQNDPPLLTNPGNQTNVEGETISLVVQGSDPEGEELTFFASGLPTGLSINTTSGEIHGLLPVGQTGHHTVVISVSDGLHLTEQSFVWVVNPRQSNGIVIDGNNSDWAAIDSVSDAEDASQSPIDIVKLWLTADDSTVYFAYQNKSGIDVSKYWAWQLVIDSDYSNSTGFKYKQIGGDYLISGGELYRYSGNGVDWQWTHVVSANNRHNNGFSEFAISKSHLPVSSSVRMYFYGANSLISNSQDELVFLDSSSSNNLIRIDGNHSDWNSVSSISDLANENTSPADIEKIWMTADENNYYLAYQDRQVIDQSKFWVWHVLFDMDYSLSTGFQFQGLGGEYLLSGRNLFRYSGTGFDWSWTLVGEVNGMVNGNFAEFEFPKSTLGSSDRLRVNFFGANTYAGGVTDDLMTANFQFGNSQSKLIDGILNDWNQADEIQDQAEPETSPVDYQSVWFSQDSDNIYLAYNNRINIDSLNFNAWLVLIDNDSSDVTGYRYEGQLGGDYLLQGNSLYKYDGNGTNWSWSFVSEISSAINGKIAEIEINKGLLGQSNNYQLLFYGNNAFSGGEENDTVLVSP